jgi:nitrile hydratase
MHTDDHDHSELSDTQLRVRALETILTEKGYVDPAVLDRIIEHYEKKTGPHIGARDCMIGMGLPRTPGKAAT